MDIYKRLEELKEQETQLKYDSYIGIEGASECLSDNLIAQFEIESIINQE